MGCQISPSRPTADDTARIRWLVERCIRHVVCIALLTQRTAGLGFSVLSLDKKAESDSGNGIMQAMAVTSTLWPILFAAVLGPTLKALALHRALRGARLGAGTLIIRPLSRVADTSRRPLKSCPRAIHL
jgi:hypothetical protein